MSENIEKFMLLPVTLIDADVADRHFEVEFVHLDGRLYVNDWRIVAQLARRRTEAKLSYSPCDQQILNELTIVDDTQPKLHAKLSDRFQEKYGHSNEVFINLEPGQQRQFRSNRPSKPEDSDGLESSCLLG